MSNSKDETSGVREQVRLLVGLLLGSGIAGAAIALIEKQPWAWAFVAFLVVASIGLFVWSEWFIEQKRRRSLSDLSSHYTQCLRTIGDLLATRLDLLSRGEADQMRTIRKDVLIILVSDLKQQSESLLVDKESKESLSVFGSGIQKVLEHWQRLSQTGSEGGGPAG